MQQLQANKKAKTEKATAKAKAKAKAKAQSKSKLVLGCCKCRGQRTGCGQCKSPSFKGARFGSPEAYQAHLKAKNSAKKSAKKN